MGRTLANASWMVNAEPQLALVQLNEDVPSEALKNDTSSRIRVLCARTWNVAPIDATPLHDVAAVSSPKRSVTKEQLASIYQGHYGNFNAILAAEKALF